MSATAKTRGEEVAIQIAAIIDFHLTGSALFGVSSLIDAERADAAKEEREAILKLLRSAGPSPILKSILGDIRAEIVRARGEQ